VDGVGVEVGVGDDVLGKPTVPPATDSEAILTNTMMANNFFSIQTPVTKKMSQKRKTGPMKLKDCYLRLKALILLPVFSN
jgi:hypothetical protein